MNGGRDKKRDFLLQQNVTRGLGEDRIGDTPETPPKRGGYYGLCMARMILHGNALFLEVNAQFSLLTDQLCQISLNAWDIVYTHQFPCTSNSPLLQDKSTTYILCRPCNSFIYSPTKPIYNNALVSRLSPQ